MAQPLPWPTLFEFLTRTELQALRCLTREPGTNTQSKTLWSLKDIRVVEDWKEFTLDEIMRSQYAQILTKQIEPRVPPALKISFVPCLEDHEEITCDVGSGARQNPNGKPDRAARTVYPDEWEIDPQHCVNKLPGEIKVS
ncbi:hypothetical protein NEOLEDRAFT_1148241 [Neolentinus lepideus HHB14362 ss-1]|uniref:Uncharacterized protein n=1 Tax=Neolentinus lepideus HHB14362 ss-1 TaxID=1314782 RepID=A0A165SCU0_9AGAM|nr:hypothetical protein NEOLEDRAFT_1148241 [Neolentinus lepideus HHB14362 ss-1]